MLIWSSVTSFVLPSERDQSACEMPEEKCFALENPDREEAVAQEPEEALLDSLINLEELAVLQKA